MGNNCLFNTAGSIALAINFVVNGPYKTAFIARTGAKTLRVYAEVYINVDDMIACIDTDVDLGVADLDAGEDFAISTTYYIYCCQPGTPTAEPVWLISENSTYPAGYAANTSRKVGGFDTDGSGEVTAASVWDLQSELVDEWLTGLGYEGLLGAAQAKTLASGVLTITGSGVYLVSPESGDADDLTSISGGDASCTVQIQAASGKTITLKHDGVNLYLQGGVDAAVSGYDVVELRTNGSSIYYERCRSKNQAYS